MTITKPTNYMPPEWAQHQATWLAWPHDTITFPNRIAKIEELYVSIIDYLHQGEMIHLLVLDSLMQSRAMELLKSRQVNLDNIIFHIVDYADVWIRDYGPTFIYHEHHLAWLKWRYNAYDNKFLDLLKDDQVFHDLQNSILSPMIATNIVLEGGAIEVNGSGVLLTTEQCLLHSNRNPNLDKHQTEEHLKKFLGIKKIVWLKKGLVNDHTDGHIDEIARFVNEDTIVCAYEEDPNDPNYAILEENYQTLLKEGSFNIIKLPLPNMSYDTNEKAPASYTNFYIANTVILMPTFDHKNDAIAQEILQSVFPHRKVIGINCSDLIYGGGTIHCITQQEPVAK